MKTEYYMNVKCVKKKIKRKIIIKEEAKKKAELKLFT